MNDDSVPKKVVVTHKFLSHSIDPETETLIVGTFNPLADGNKADFFYGGHWNQLWDLLPEAFQERSLREELAGKQKTFCKRWKIDFIDVITKVEVDAGKETSRKDSYIDNKVVCWRDVTSEIKKLPNLTLVCFTREKFGGTPNIKRKIYEIIDHCQRSKITFKFLVSPSPARRLEKKKKQEEWNRVFRLNRRPA